MKVTVIWSFDVKFVLELSCFSWPLHLSHRDSDLHLALSFQISFWEHRSPDGWIVSFFWGHEKLVLDYHRWNNQWGCTGGFCRSSCRQNLYKKFKPSSTHILFWKKVEFTSTFGQTCYLTILRWITLLTDKGWKVTWASSAYNKGKSSFQKTAQTGSFLNYHKTVKDLKMVKVKSSTGWMFCFWFSNCPPSVATCRPSSPWCLLSKTFSPVHAPFP